MSRLVSVVRDLSLRGKVTLTLAAVFTGSVVVLLLALVPILREQRERLVEQDRRLLTTLRRNYEREFIYDLLSENRESLAVHLAALAGQEGIVWARIEADDLDLGATADTAAIRRLLGEDVKPLLDEPEVVPRGGPGGPRRARGGGRAHPAARPPGPARGGASCGGSGATGGDDFRETSWGGQRVLALTDHALRAAASRTGGCTCSTASRPCSAPRR